MNLSDFLKKEVGCDAVLPKIRIDPHVGGAHFNVGGLFCKIRRRETTLAFCRTCGLVTAETTRQIISTTRGLFEAQGFYSAYKEFKVLLEKEELTDITQKGIDTFMIELKEKRTDLDEGESSETEFICPYCGQRAPSDSWWTQEQLAYVGVVAKNIMATIVNENLIRPLKGTFRRFGSGMVSTGFESKEIEQQEPWISPEVNAMAIFDLPCCQRKIKIEENWSDAIYCFFCGFPFKSVLNLSKMPVSAELKR